MSPRTLAASAVPALAIDHMSVSYGGMRAVSDVSLRVPEGSVVALLGTNGAGKSTTLRAASGLVRPDRGRIEVCGERVDNRPAHQIAQMGVVHVPEGRGIFPALTVRENLDIAARLARRAGGGDSDPVDVAAGYFPILRQRLRQRAGSLSGGEQQMLALSRALLFRPRLLMVDEISMGLAPLVVAQLFDIIRSRSDSGMSVLLVEQYVDAALSLADFVYVLDRGQIVDVGEPSDIRSDGLAAAYLGG